jgi:PTS system mannitol-specific IIA component
MLEREKSVSTYMGNLLAIPHGTNEGKDTILDSALSFVRYDAPLDWAGNEVRFVVGIAGKDNGHLDILSKIAIIFSDDDEVQKLLDAPDAEALYALLAEVNEA